MRCCRCCPREHRPRRTERLSGRCGAIGYTAGPYTAPARAMSKVLPMPGKSPPKSAAGPAALSSIGEVLAELRAGRMVIIMDDEDRENEGDLIMAAEHA